MKRPIPIVLAASLVAGLAIGAAAPALAQSVGSTSSLRSPSFNGGMAQAPAASQKKREKAPPALPGARAEPTEVTPAARTAADLPPNEALFDAINRGDLPTAKDAVNRGADLNGTNVLGLTPIELAVDLGRNEISFYLLSMRGGTTTASRGPGKDSAPKPPTRAERLAADRAARAERVSTARSARVATLQAPPGPQTARLFVGGGGNPSPQAGFLGFNASR